MTGLSHEFEALELTCWSSRSPDNIPFSWCLVAEYRFYNKDAVATREHSCVICRSFTRLFFISDLEGSAGNQKKKRLFHSAMNTSNVKKGQCAIERPQDILHKIDIQSRTQSRLGWRSGDEGYWRHKQHSFSLWTMDMYQMWGACRFITVKP